MAQEEVNYTSVVFKTNKESRLEDKEEVVVYDEVKTRSETPEKASAAQSTLLLNEEEKRKRQRYSRLVCCFGTCCFILLLAAIGVLVWLALRHERVAKELGDYETLRNDLSNLTGTHRKLSQSFDDLNSKFKNISAKNEKLRTQSKDLEEGKKELEVKNKELETQKQNLTEKMQEMKTQWNEKNVSRAQWSIDEYCPKNNSERKCKPCQEGWLYFQSSCYAVNNVKQSDQKTWKEARQDCRRKNSDLVVVFNEDEKEYVNNQSWPGGHSSGEYWLGLRVVDGKWKWINGSDLSEKSWIQEGTNGNCAASVKDKEWKLKNCEEKHRWICEKKALSV